MQRAHKIRLNPNNIQATYFKKACGVKRFCFNWGLAEWKRQYALGLKPSAFQLKKEFNAVKKELFPFVAAVTKCAAECAFSNLDRAFKNFFKKTSRYPKFKKKGQKDSFYLTNTAFKVSGKFIAVPKLGKVRMAEELRFAGKIQSAVVSQTAGLWFVSISVDTPDQVCEDQTRLAVGVDLGIKKLAVLSDGTKFENPKATKKFEKKIRKLNKSLARKVKGSSNWEKAKAKLALSHYHLGCVRTDSIHKMTTLITKKYYDVCLEDLNVKGMIKNSKLAKAVGDASFSEIRRQIEYKADRVHLVSMWFPSTRLCSSCGQLHKMPLSKRIFECDCGLSPVDRDLNAARNILLEGIRRGSADFKPVEKEALAN